LEHGAPTALPKGAHTGTFQFEKQAIFNLVITGNSNPEMPESTDPAGQLPGDVI
jgi:hypothetical protein